MGNYSGVFKAKEQSQNRGKQKWTIGPNAPTNLVVTEGEDQVTLTFDAPTNTFGVPLLSYVGVATDQNGTEVTGTTSANPDGTVDNTVTITGLTAGNDYTYKVYGTSSNGSGDSVQTASAAFLPKLYATAGTYTFTVPAGVTSISVAAIGGGGGGSGWGGGGYGAGGGGGGGAFRYVNNYSVTAGDQFTVTVGAGGLSQTTNNGSSATSGGASSVLPVGGSNIVRAVGGGHSGGNGGSGGVGSGGNGGYGAGPGGSYGGGVTGGGGAGGAGGKTANGGDGSPGSSNNGAYSHSTHGSASGGAGGFGGGSNGRNGGGVGFDTAGASATTRFSEVNQPHTGARYHQDGYYGGGGGGSYGGTSSSHISYDGQGGAVQIKWGNGGTY